MDDDPVTVGVLSLHNSKETKAILNAVEALGHTPEWLRSENTVVRFENEQATLTPDVDVVVNRLLLSNTDQPSEDSDWPRLSMAFGRCSTPRTRRPVPHTRPRRRPP